MNRALLSALVLCFAAGCDQKPADAPKPKTSQAVTPLPPEAPKAAAASANQDAKTLVGDANAATPKAGTPPPPPRIKGCGNGKCVLRIRVDKPGEKDCDVTLNAKDLKVAGTNQTIQWHALGGWKFETNGIELPAGASQFSNPRRDSGGGKFEWDDANTNDKLSYKYTIRMTKGKEKCVNDPSIVNGADDIDPNYPPPGP